MAIKTYVLLPHTESSAPIYRRINQDQRIRLSKRVVEQPFLRITFNDQREEIVDLSPDSATYGKKIPNPKFDKNVTIRLKLTSNTIFQDQQIKDGILANEPFTPAERACVQFHNGVLMTSNPIVQWYLESSPQFNGFKGLCDSVRQPLYEVFDPVAEVSETNKDIRRRTAAVVKVMGLELKEAQDLIIRLNGSYVKTSDDLLEVQNSLVDFIDNAGDLELAELMKDSINVDQEVTIIIGRAIKEGLLSFDQEPNQVSKKKGDGWVNVKMVSSDVDKIERERLFSVFLTSPEGKLLLEDLKADLAKAETKKSKKEKVVA